MYVYPYKVEELPVVDSLDGKKLERAMIPGMVYTCPKLMWFPSQLTLPLYSAGALCQVCLADYLANIFVYTLESSRNINGQICIKFSATQKVKVESMVSFATFGVSLTLDCLVHAH